MVLEPVDDSFGGRFRKAGSSSGSPRASNMSAVYKETFTV
jgi:hypothetical protein